MDPTDQVSFAMLGGIHLRTYPTCDDFHVDTEAARAVSERPVYWIQAGYSRLMLAYLPIQPFQFVFFCSASILAA